MNPLLSSLSLLDCAAAPARCSLTTASLGAPSVPSPSSAGVMAAPAASAKVQCPAGCPSPPTMFAAPQAHTHLHCPASCVDLGIIERWCSARILEIFKSLCFRKLELGLTYSEVRGERLVGGFASWCHWWWYCRYLPSLPEVGGESSHSMA